MTVTGWRARAAAKRNETLSKIPRQWILPSAIVEEAKQQRTISGEYIGSLLDGLTRSITTSTNESLIRLMAQGDLSAKGVIMAFCKRAAIAHQLNQTLLEITFESAMVRADELDAYYQQHHRLIGPLHGLPYTMKDQWHMKGVDTTMAYVGWLGTQGGQPRTAADKDLESQLVDDLSMLGAIPIGKTSLMQTLWGGENDNNILGYLWNPNVRGLSTGGSSGGEGALQSLGGSSFGFGTDIGGSIAMPAAANGVCGFKPSHGRISMRNTVNSSPGQTLIPTVPGIFGRSINDVQHVFRTLLTTRPWLRDPELLPIPYRSDEVVKDKQLTFGLFAFDDVAMPHPPIARALQNVSKAVTLMGHIVVPWIPPSHVGVEELHGMVTGADGQADIFHRTRISGEPFKASLCIEPDEVPSPPIPVSEYYSIAQRVHEWRAEYAAYWNSTSTQTNTGRPVDALIMPVAPQVAPRPGMAYHYGYSCVINVLDYCSAVIPVSTVDKTVDVINSDYEPVGEKDYRTWKAYDPEIYHGAPIGVQIVCRRLEEEKLLSIADVVARALAAGKHGHENP